MSHFLSAASSLTDPQSSREARPHCAHKSAWGGTFCENISECVAQKATTVCPRGPKWLGAAQSEDGAGVGQNESEHERKQGVKRTLHEWDRHTKSALIDLRSEKAISALYVELSGCHGSVGKGHISTKALSTPYVAVSLDKTFCRQGGKKRAII